MIMALISRQTDQAQSNMASASTGLHLHRQSGNTSAVIIYVAFSYMHIKYYSHIYNECKAITPTNLLATARKLVSR